MLAKYNVFISNDFFYFSFYEETQSCTSYLPIITYYQQLKLTNSQTKLLAQLDFVVD